MRLPHSSQRAALFQPALLDIAWQPLRNFEDVACFKRAILVSGSSPDRESFQGHVTFDRRAGLIVSGASLLGLRRPRYAQTPEYATRMEMGSFVLDGTSYQGLECSSGSVTKGDHDYGFQAQVQVN